MSGDLKVLFFNQDIGKRGVYKLSRFRILVFGERQNLSLNPRYITASNAFCRIHVAIKKLALTGIVSTF